VLLLYNTTKSMQFVQISASHHLVLLLSDYQILSNLGRYIKLCPSYFELKFFRTAVLTLQFDFHL